MDKTSTLVSYNHKNIKNKPFSEMESVDYEPSEQSIQNILNYSKSLTVKKSALVDFIEVVAS